MGYINTRTAENVYFTTPFLRITLNIGTFVCILPFTLGTSAVTAHYCFVFRGYPGAEK